MYLKHINYIFKEDSELILNSIQICNAAYKSYLTLLDLSSFTPSIKSSSDASLVLFDLSLPIIVMLPLRH